MPDLLHILRDPEPAAASPHLRQIPVSETFTSIQGEGLLSGTPSFFLRASGCNLRCRWCDTPYASWEPDGSPTSIDDLVAFARESGVAHAVLTGGEPMLFGELCQLSTRLARPRSEGGAGMHITIETAGTVVPYGDRWPLTCDLLSISPKLANSTPAADPRDPSGAWASRHEARRLNLPVLQQLLDRFPAPHRQLKFVVCTGSDLDEIDALVSRLRGVAPTDIFLMPEGVTPPTAEHRQLVLNACLARGWRYGHRLHIELFGNRRGT